MVVWFGSLGCVIDFVAILLFVAFDICVFAGLVLLIYSWLWLFAVVYVCYYGLWFAECCVGSLLIVLV